MTERDATPPTGDAVRGRTEAEVEELLGETGALPQAGAPQDATARRPAQESAEDRGTGEGERAAHSPAPTQTGQEGADGSPAALRAQIADLRAQGERLQGELAAERERADGERTSRARVQADFENVRRRMLAEQPRWQDDARKALIADLLASVDNLERASQAAGDVDSLKKGVDLTLRQLQETFRRAGLEGIEVAPGAPFDPRLHEAVASVPSAAHADGQIVKVERRGYTFKGALLRPALVAVAKTPPGRETQA